MEGKIKYLCVQSDELINCGLRAEVREVARQIWRPQDSWIGYIGRPRPYSGLTLICSETELLYTFEGGTLTAHMGDVIYVPGGIQYQMTSVGSAHESRLDSYTVNFDLFDRDGNKILISDSIFLLSEGNNGRQYGALFAELYEAYCMESIGLSRNALKQEATFLYLLDRILTDFRGQSSLPYYPTRRGVHALTVEWNQNRAIGVYASMCHLSESYFYHVFKRSMGLSPVEYRNRIRITNACSLLESTSASVDEIAALVGFETPFYFSRVFKRAMGVSPRQYREHKS